MARLITNGAEGRDADGTNTNQIDGFLTGGVVPTYETTIVRSGSRSMKCGSGAGNATSIWRLGFQGYVANTTFYMRGYIRVDALPASTVRVMDWGGGATFSARLTSTGILQFWNDSAGTQIGSNSVQTIAINNWYRIEIQVICGATQITGGELRLDSTTIASVTGLTLGAAGNQNAGWNDAPGANKNLYVDDCAVNDNTGSAQNSWCGEGSTVLLVPTSDNAGGTGWTLGTGTALGGNGFAAEDNQPPVGVADLAAGSDPKQIRNAANSANTNYDANMQTYASAGINPFDTISVVVPVVMTAAPVVTSAKQGTVGIVSNPTIANVALAAGGTAGAFWSGAAGDTYPVGWKLSLGTATYSPALTLSTSPVMRITQVTASTRIAVVCFMGIMVDYVPSQAPYRNPMPKLLAQ